MNKLFLVGDNEALQSFIDDYIKKYKFAPYEIEKFSDKIKIEIARNIIKSLSYRVGTKKLYILSGEFTVEAQNALLKSLEESDENIHFLLCAQNENQILSTIRSRCLIINLNFNSSIDKNLSSLIRNMYSEKNISWQAVDELISFISEKNPQAFLPAMRSLLLSGLEDEINLERYYFFCKKFIALLPLVQKNNVSEKTFIESCLLSEAKVL